MNKIFTLVAILALGLAIGPVRAGNDMPPAKAASNISGKVVDLSSGETLAGVTVIVQGTETRVYTDLDGNFTIKDIEPGTYNLVFSMISYKNSLVENMILQPNEEEILEVKLDNN